MTAFPLRNVTQTKSGYDEEYHFTGSRQTDLEGTTQNTFVLLWVFCRGLGVKKKLRGCEKTSNAINPGV